MKTEFKGLNGNNQCTAKTTTTGKRCKNVAVKGKDKCRKHGGSTPVKHGLDSKYIHSTILAKEKLAEIRESKRYLDIEDKLCTLQAIIDYLRDGIEQKSSENTLETEDIELFTKHLTDYITQLEKYTKIIETVRNIQILENMDVVLEQIGVVITDEVVDRKTCKRISNRLAKLTISESL